MIVLVSWWWTSGQWHAKNSAANDTVAFLKEKSKMVYRFKTFVKQVKMVTGACVQMLQSNGGNKYGSWDFVRS